MGDFAIKIFLLLSYVSNNSFKLFGRLINNFTFNNTNHSLTVHTNKNLFSKSKTLKNSIKKIYIDIDGVLLDKKQNPPEGAQKFIEFIVTHFDCHWLTTHCRSKVNKAVDYLSPFYDKKTIDLFHTIQPTNWETLKTEAIDFENDFFWIEDYPFEAEMRILEKKNVLHSLIKVDLNQPRELERIEKLLSNDCLKNNESGNVL